MGIVICVTRVGDLTRHATYISEGIGILCTLGHANWYSGFWSTTRCLLDKDEVAKGFVNSAE